MKPPSKVELLTRCEALSADNCVLLQALNLLANGEFKTVGRKASYTVRLAEPTAPNGGIVLVTFAPGGQRPYTTAHYLDQWFSFWKDSIPALDNNEAQAMRGLAYDAKRLASVAQQQPLTTTG